MTNLAEALQKLDIRQRALQTMERNKGLDLFCSRCFRPTGDLTTCPYCSGISQGKEVVIPLCKAQIEDLVQVIQLIRSGPVPSSPEPVRTKVTRAQESEEDDGEEKQLWTDTEPPHLGEIAVNVYQNGVVTVTVVFAGPRLARQWLRRQGFSVRNAVKLGNVWSLFEPGLREEN